jgi:hypothetical protein
VSVPLEQHDVLEAALLHHFGIVAPEAEAAAPADEEGDAEAEA